MFDYWKWDNEVPDWLCNQIISEIDWSTSPKAEVSEKDGTPSINENVRISNVAWKENYSPIGCIAQTFVKMANKNANWNYDLNSCSQIQIGKYEQHGKYDWHMDNDFKGNFNNSVRKLSISILLNDDFEGGKFEFKKQDLDVNLKKGSILVFPSYLEHRVAPVISGVRYSAVAWVSGPPFK
jgi:PKHD-type hydroxylase